MKIRRLLPNGCRSPEAPTIYPQATKISNREPKWVPLNLILRLTYFRTNNKIPCSFCSFRVVKTAGFWNLKTPFSCFKTWLVWVSSAFLVCLVTCNAPKRCVMVKIGCDEDFRFREAWIKFHEWAHKKFS